jgi:D-alanyl-D-alanine carboxypeptidase
MGLAQHLDVQRITLLNPVAPKSVQDIIRYKLQSRDNTFKVHNGISLMPKIYADSDLSQVHAYGLIDYDTGDVIQEYNLSQPVPIASLTKIMTAIVSLDLDSPDDIITISDYAATMIPTKIGVVPGEKMTLHELLEASLMTSANDATQAIADGIDAKYGQAVFVNSMNQKAQFLKLKHTHFANPEGLDQEGNYSTVEDLAVLTHYAMQNPLIAEIVKQDKTFLPANEYHKQFDLPNWNGLLGVYPDTIGMKIGNTYDAAYTMVVLSQRAGKHLMAIVLGASDVMDRDMKAAELLDMGYQLTMNLDPVNVTQDQLRTKYQTWN